MVEAHTNLTTMFRQFVLICSVPYFYRFGVASSCPRDDYRVGLECCPSCPPGMRVEEDCTERRITQCSWCPNATFQAGRNEQKQCSSCTKCDAGLGLKVKKSCTSTSDALCEVLDGFFCSDSNRGGCRAAQRHTVCSPGQYIGQRGTADKDTECLHCTNGTFSNGASSCCHPHTKCESVGLELMKPGTESTDSECGKHCSCTGLVAAIVIPVMVVMALIIAIIQREKIREFCRRRLQAAQEPEMEFDELDNRIRKQETLEQGTECNRLVNRLWEQEKTPEQERKSNELADQIRKRRKKTQEPNREFDELIDQLLERKKTPEQQRKLDELIVRHLKAAQELEMEFDGNTGTE